MMRQVSHLASNLALRGSHRFSRWPLIGMRHSVCILLFVLSASIRAASAGFIDDDTPLDKRTTKSLIDGSTYDLVMSDEFNVPNRTFKDGHDPVWTALDKSDDDASSAGGGSLQFYNSTTVTTTKDGMLRISSILDKTEWTRYDHVNKTYKHETSYYKSGMMQSWEKFCFTGGIIEVDVIFPGEAYIGGLWPAVWMLGNLGRATYEVSTNNIWPWSFDKCDRELQQAQAISACNAQNHYGLHPFQGRGATEIDIIEVMSGNSNGNLPGTDPGVAIPYADMTLQVAPGILKNRPQSGAQPQRNNTLSANGHTELLAETWYKGLKLEGNTSINPFFYGTYLAETKPNEPVTRSKKQAFQADAVGVVHQLTPAHFRRIHTFRLEWQPGPGGRIDWFSQGHRINSTFFMEGDGKGKDWVHAFSIKDKSLKDTMASQIPNEPSYLIMNTAISSTWGFPYDAPDWCPKCYDCDDPKCACSFQPGFCEMMRQGNVAMYIDSIRVYQSSDHSAHVGNKHTLGCDPPEYPTKDFIKGHEYRYMRQPPFGYYDKHPLKEVQKGGGPCKTDSDCGGHIIKENLTETYLGGDGAATQGRGQCGSFARGLLGMSRYTKTCECNEGFTGPHCLALDHIDNSPSAHDIQKGTSPFKKIENMHLTPFMFYIVGVMVAFLLTILITHVILKKKEKSVSPVMRRPVNAESTRRSDLVITGRSI